MYFARLDRSNKVIQVIVADSQDFVNNLNGEWLETHVDGSSRKNYAGVGFSYDPSRDAFVPPKPYSSWLLNDETCRWDPPTPKPEDMPLSRWDEDSQSWVNES